MSVPLLRVRGLSVQYATRRPGLRARAGTVTALDAVNLELAEGRSMGVVGESGCGKSTLSRAILGLVEPQAGTVEWRGQLVRRSDAAVLKRMRRELQVVFQDPFGSLDPRMTIGESVAEALDALESIRDPAAAARRIAGSLEEVGLDPSLASRYPHELSGGQCQRAAIARATIVRPRLLICDEAVSALDVSVQAQIVNLLRDLSERHGMGLLFISHNLAVVRYLCQEVVVLYRGRLVERGPRDALFAAPLHPYTRALLAAVPRPVPGAAPWAAPIRAVADPADLPEAAGCLYRGRCPAADGMCAREVPALRDADAGHLAACHHPGATLVG